MSPSAIRERIVPRRRPGRWIAAACLLVALALLGNAFASAKAINWSVVGKFISEGVILEGLRVTIELAIVAQIGALIRRLGQMGVTLILAEQNMHFCLGIATHAAVIDKGSIVFRDTIAALKANEDPFLNW